MQKSRDKKEKGNHKIKIQSFFLSAISTFFLTVSILNIIFLGGGMGREVALGVPCGRP